MSFGSTQGRRERTSGEPKRVLRGGGHLEATWLDLAASGSAANRQGPYEAFPCLARTRRENLAAENLAVQGAGDGAEGRVHDAPPSISSAIRSQSLAIRSACAASDAIARTGGRCPWSRTSTPSAAACCSSAARCRSAFTAPSRIAASARLAEASIDKTVDRPKVPPGSIGAVMAPTRRTASEFGREAFWLSGRLRTRPRDRRWRRLRRPCRRRQTVARHHRRWRAVWGGGRWGRGGGWRTGGSGECGGSRWAGRASESGG